jgi:hypothetical protein
MKIAEHLPEGEQKCIYIADPNLGTAVTILAICTKTVSNVGWFLNYVQTMELYPTCARVSGMNFCTIISTAIGIWTPKIVSLVKNRACFHLCLIYL